MYKEVLVVFKYLECVNFSLTQRSSVTKLKVQFRFVSITGSEGSLHTDTVVDIQN